MGVEWFLVAVRTHRLWTLDIQIHDNRILPASDHHGLTRYIYPGIDFLMRDVGRNINEIARAGFVAELQPIAPAHPGPTSDDVYNSLQFAMMVRTGLGVRLNHYGTGPQLTCPGTRMSNGGGPCHSRSLGRVHVQFPCMHDLHTIVFPVQMFVPKVRRSTEYPSTAIQKQVGDVRLRLPRRP